MPNRKRAAAARSKLSADDWTTAATDRVTRRRRPAYPAGLFGALGFPPAQVQLRSQLAYTASLGHAQLRHATPRHATPDMLPGGEASIETVLATLTSR